MAAGLLPGFLKVASAKHEKKHHRIGVRHMIGKARGGERASERPRRLQWC